MAGMIAMVKLEGILLVTDPPGCRVEGKVIALSPTIEIHFDGWNVMSVPMDVTQDG